MRDYTWENYATGTYTSNFYAQLAGSPAVMPLVMQKAAESDNLYRLADVFVEGYHFELTWDGGETVAVNGILTDGNGLIYLDTGLTYGSYGALYFAVQTASYAEAGNTFSFNATPAVSAGYPTDKISTDTFVMDQPGN